MIEALLTLMEGAIVLQRSLLRLQLMILLARLEYLSERDRLLLGMGDRLSVLGLVEMRGRVAENLEAVEGKLHLLTERVG